MTTVVLQIPVEMAKLQALGETTEEIQRELRIAMAANLFQRGRISLGRAAELAGVQKVRFMFMLGEMGIPVINIDDDDDIEHELSFGRG